MRDKIVFAIGLSLIMSTPVNAGKQEKSAAKIVTALQQYERSLSKEVLDSKLDFMSVGSREAITVREYLKLQEYILPTFSLKAKKHFPILDNSQENVD